MSFLLGFFLLVSLTCNIILVWYSRKLVKNLSAGVEGLDDLQQLLDEYASLLSGMAELEQYYGDETVVGAVKNTKMVIEACKFYKKSVLNTETDNMEKTTFDTTKTR